MGFRPDDPSFKPRGTNPYSELVFIFGLLIAVLVVAFTIVAVLGFVKSKNAPSPTPTPIATRHPG